MLHQLAVAFLSLIALIPGHSSAAAQSDPLYFSSGAEFEGAGAGLTRIDFEAVVPGGGFLRSPLAEGLTGNEINFRASGGGRFGAGFVYVLSAS